MASPWVPRELTTTNLRSSTSWLFSLNWHAVLPLSDRILSVCPQPSLYLCQYLGIREEEVSAKSFSTVARSAPLPLHLTDHLLAAVIAGRQLDYRKSTVTREPCCRQSLRGTCPAVT